jgi:hypothetical protein
MSLWSKSCSVISSAHYDALTSARLTAMNAVLLNAPAPGQSWDTGENSVKAQFCLPKKVADFVQTTRPRARLAADSSQAMVASVASVAARL